MWLTGWLGLQPSLAVNVTGWMAGPSAQPSWECDWLFMAGWLGLQPSLAENVTGCWWLAGWAFSLASQNWLWVCQVGFHPRWKPRTSVNVYHVKVNMCMRILCSSIYIVNMFFVPFFFILALLFSKPSQVFIPNWFYILSSWLQWSQLHLQLFVSNAGFNAFL